jgi:hypothetical protein
MTQQLNQTNKKLRQNGLKSIQRKLQIPPPPSKIIILSYVMFNLQIVSIEEKLINFNLYLIMVKLFLSNYISWAY